MCPVTKFIFNKLLVGMSELKDTVLLFFHGSQIHFWGENLCVIVVLKLMEVRSHHVSLSVMWRAPVKIALKTKSLCIDSSYSLLSKHDMTTIIRKICWNLPLPNTMPSKFLSRVRGQKCNKPLLLWQLCLSHSSQRWYQQSLYTSSDVKLVPQFTDVLPIEDNTGSLRERQNKDKPVVSREDYPADGFSEPDKRKDIS